jgi:hypothetical protein
MAMVSGEPEATRVWLTFDLGIGGDYEAMYEWLDRHDAEECGEYAATFHMTVDGDVFQVLKTEIEGVVRISKKTRIYAVAYETGKYRGKFIFGRRKAAAWKGFSQGALQSDDSY